MGALTNAKREQFCQEYLVDNCATRAAVRAGYSEKSAKQIACDLIGEADVRERILELQAERADRLRVTQDDVLRELALIATSSVEDFVIDDRGAVKLAAGVPAHMMRSVSSIKRRVRTTKDGVTTVETEIKLWDKPAALRMAGQHLGMFTEKHELNHTGTVRFLPPTVPPKDEAQEARDA